VSMLKPILEDSTNWRVAPVPLPVVMADGTEEYEVERIISQRHQRGRTQYLVKWLDFPISESTWEEESSLTHCDFALKDFQEKARRHTS
jgi:hypothetical protein